MSVNQLSSDKNAERVCSQCEMFLAQIEDGHITQVKARQFLSELKDYIEESNDGVTP